MKHFCVIGDPVEHSLSPRLHRRMIELTGLDATYDLCPVRAQELERFIEQARGGAWDGFNVTMPHKEAVVPYLDGLSGTAARCRAVNTVCMEDGRAIGHNTDGLGFIESLRAHGFDPADKTALIIGTGGNGLSFIRHAANMGAEVVACVGSGRRARALSISATAASTARRPLPRAIPSTPGGSISGRTPFAAARRRPTSS